MVTYGREGYGLDVSSRVCNIGRRLTCDLNRAARRKQTAKVKVHFVFLHLVCCPSCLIQYYRNTNLTNSPWTSNSNAHREPFRKGASLGGSERRRRQEERSMQRGVEAKDAPPTPRTLPESSNATPAKATRLRRSQVSFLTITCQRRASLQRPSTVL